MPIDIKSLTGRAAGIASGSRSTVAQRTAKGGATRTSAATNSGEQVELTGMATVLGRIEEAIRSLPVIDSHRVNALQMAVRQGRYQVDAPRTARKMIAMETQMALLDRRFA